MSRLYSLFEKQGGADLIKEYARTGFLWKVPFQLISTGFSNKGLEILRLSANLHLYRRMKKKYFKYFDETSFNQYPSDHQISNKVWVCWFQGIENAPLLVRRCYESIKKNLSDKEIILITDENLSEYVTFPEYITEKYKSGAITRTHLTDLLRLELLTKYGGIWIDATVLCTGNIPQYITDSDLFFFRTLKPGLDGHAVGLSSWFISSKTNNKVLIAVKELMYKYWMENNHLIDYFLIHNFLRMALEKYPEEERKMIKSSNSTPHILLLDMFNEYNPMIYQAIKQQTTIHKLAYKRSKEELEKKGTYYDVIINQGNY